MFDTVYSDVYVKAGEQVCRLGIGSPNTPDAREQYADVTHLLAGLFQGERSWMEFGQALTALVPIDTAATILIALQPCVTAIPAV